MAIFDPENEIDRIKAKDKLNKLLAGNKRFEIKAKNPIRTLSQNRYLHLILNYFAIEYGDNMSYCKEEIFKRLCNKQIFEYEKTNTRTGEIRTALRSSADLKSDEMTTSIERFRNYSAQNICYLPAPNENKFLEHIEAEIERHKEYI